MRTAITIGITEDGEAEIISHPNVPVDEQRRAFNGLDAGKKDKFAEIHLVELGRRSGKRHRFNSGAAGGVDFNAAHPVENQQAKGKAKKRLADLTPTSGGTGGVDFNSAHPVEKQQDKKLSKKLPDLNKAQDKGATGKKSGVDFASALPVEEQGSSSRKGAKTAKSGKARTRRGGKSAPSNRRSGSDKSADNSSEPTKDEKPADSDPTL